MTHDQEGPGTHDQGDSQAHDQEGPYEHVVPLSQRLGRAWSRASTWQRMWTLASMAVLTLAALLTIGAVVTGNPRTEEPEDSVPSDGLVDESVEWTQYDYCVHNTMISRDYLIEARGSDQATIDVATTLGIRTPEYDIAFDSYRVYQNTALHYGHNRGIDASSQVIYEQCNAAYPLVPLSD